MCAIAWALLALTASLVGIRSAPAQEASFNEYSKIANDYFDRKEYARAAEYFEMALNVAVRTWPADDQRVTLTADNLGRSYLNIDNYKKGLNAYVIVYKAVKGCRTKEERHSAIRSVYAMCQALNGLERYGEVAPYAKWGISVLESGVHDRNYFDLLYWELGVSYEYQNEFARAEEAYRSCVKYAESRDSKRFYTARIGWLKFRQKEYESAVNITKEAIAMIDNSTTDGTKIKASYFLDLATIYEEKGDLSAADRTLTSAVEYYRDAGVSERQGVARTLERRARLAERTKNYADARSRRIEASQVYSELGDSVALGNCFYNFAWEAYRQKNYDDADEFAKKAQVAHEAAKTKDRLDVAWDIDLLGHVALRRHKYAQAEKYFEAVCEIRRAAEGQPNLEVSERSLATAKSRGEAVAGLGKNQIESVQRVSRNPAIGDVLRAETGDAPP